MLSKGTRPARRYTALIGILLLAAGLRLGLATIAGPIIDIENFERVAATILRSGPLALYQETEGQYPYPPVWFIWETAAYMLARGSALPFALWVRLPTIAADMGIVWLIWHWTRHRSPGQAMWRSFGYAVNPVPLIITGLHGQFDAIALFFTLLALYNLEHRGRYLSAALNLAVGIAVKSFPVLLLPPALLQLRTTRARTLFGAAAVAPVLLLLLPYVIAMPSALWRELFGYRGAALLGFMVPIRTLYVPLVGESVPAELTHQIVSISAYLFLAAYLFAIWYQQRRGATLVNTAIAILSLFYLVYAGIAPQYLIWIVPFMSVGDASTGRPLLLYSATGALALVGFYAYAISGLIPGTQLLSRPVTQVLYGFSGTLWWLVCLVLVWHSFFGSRAVPGAGDIRRAGR